jgi:hypothetical protein
MPTKQAPETPSAKQIKQAKTQNVTAVLKHFAGNQRNKGFGEALPLHRCWMAAAWLQPIPS